MAGEKDLAQLVEDVLREHGKIRKVISLLYDVDMEKRFLAAKALGEIARRNPELIKQRWGRIFYAFDDTMSCWGVAEGLGEIGRNMPELRGKIILFLRKFERDECSCQGYIWAVCRIGQVEPGRVREIIPDIVRFLDSENVCMVGQTIWALGELGEAGAAGKIRTFLGDGREMWLFDNDAVVVKTIGRIAEEALVKIDAARHSAGD